MPLSLEDRLAIHELIALHGHLVDDGDLHRLDELLTPDAVYDLSDFGRPPLIGIDAFREAALALGAANPVAHHVTNVVIVASDADSAQVRSKGLGVMVDGSCGSVSYDDTVVRTPGGWRISRRQMAVRRVPLNGAG
ncbi:nuclear transport factor 2 family protein [Streptomyces acidiscabies]|uniref:Polyketide cyclase n=1 Tax=Streptomyces acidiscabies TaxID=42234 RepID=A0A0L0K6J2_9ACTN|nr:nuclear transport factor 2 family protein [Streptomyces acidiscabies]KND33471.1 polyketide cyclase [Streptomyces acidiscabies]